MTPTTRGMILQMPAPVRVDVAPFPAAELVPLPEPDNLCKPQSTWVVVAWFAAAIFIGVPLGLFCGALWATAILLSLSWYGVKVAGKSLWRLAKRSWSAARDALYWPPRSPEYDPLASWQARMGTGEAQVRRAREDAESLGRREVHLLLFAAAVYAGLLVPVFGVLWS